jgi:glutaredoxin 3
MSRFFALDSVLNYRVYTCSRKGNKVMSNRRKIEVFSAGCPACEEAIRMVNAIACSSCEVEVLDMHQPDVAARAKQYGVRSIPAVVVDGNLADCCAGLGIDEATLRAAGVGASLP